MKKRPDEYNEEALSIYIKKITREKREATENWKSGWVKLCPEMKTADYVIEGKSIRQM